VVIGEQAAQMLITDHALEPVAAGLLNDVPFQALT